MLRPSHWIYRSRNCYHFAAFAVVALSSLGAAPAANGQAASPTERLGLEAVPADATLVVSVRPAEIAARPELRELTQLIDPMMMPLKETNTSVRDIREVMFIAYGTLPQPANFGRSVRFVDAAHQKQFVEATASKFNIKKAPEVGVWSDDSERVMEVGSGDARDREVFENRPERAARNEESSPPKWAETWQKRKDQPVVVVVDAVHIAPDGAATRGRCLRWEDCRCRSQCTVIDHTDWGAGCAGAQRKVATGRHGQV